MNHNEIEAFSDKNNFSKKIILIWITDSTYHTRNKKRIAITSKILKKEIKNQISLNIKYSKNKISHYLQYILFFDWISYYCAILNKIDPSIIPNINKLKKSL